MLLIITQFRLGNLQLDNELIIPNISLVLMVVCHWWSGKANNMEILQYSFR